MLPHYPIPMILERTEVMTCPCCFTVPVITLVSLPLHLPCHVLRQEHILILSIIVPSLADDGAFNPELPPSLLGEVFCIRCIIERHLQTHVVGHGIGARNPSHQGIVPSVGSLPIILKRNDPGRFLVEGGLYRPLGCLLLDNNPFFGPVGIQRDLIFVGRVEGGYFGLVVWKNRVGQWRSNGEYRMGVDRIHLLAVFLNFRLLILEMGVGFDVFGVMLGYSEGFR
mmetsp:Transcript_7599/g.18855  ORF Transcript_7599/g.18855 Transcript_7599/m.18855 type:complete len:225 (-) Transcript_7599:161-835(-)